MNLNLEQSVFDLNLAFAVFQPQHSIPDVFVWLVSGTKRLAYQRIPARHLLYSMIDEEKGKDSGMVQTLFLKVSQGLDLSNQILFREL